jgi:elongation factor Ts
MMTKVTADMVKELRERTGVAMGKCKEALDQTGGDMEAAIDYLRKAGMASAVKKEGREAKEGVIGTAENATGVSLVEMNAETDFVTQNEHFKAFLKDVAHEVVDAKPASVEALLNMKSRKDHSLTVDQQRAQFTLQLGENIQIKRFTILHKSNDVSIGIYSHMGGKIVTAVVLTGGTGHESIARDIAMHVAAESPEYLRPDEVPEETRLREEEIAKSQIKGKPADMVDKIVQGKLNAFYDQVCLPRQKFVKDNSVTVDQFLHNESKRLGKTLTIKSFVRWKVGA